MPYRLVRDETLPGGVRRVASEQITAALDDLRALHATDVAEAIHDCRKRCKKLRGLVRLVRPALGDQYTAANEAFRDAARVLSGVRDAAALLGTFDRVVTAAGHDVPAGLGCVRAELRRRRRLGLEAIACGDDRVAEAERLLSAASESIDDWVLDDDGWDAVGGGLRRSYARGVDALAAVLDGPTPDRHHELRKRAKYTWHHLRLLERAAPSVLGPLAGNFHDLTDALGDAHDLAVLGRQLRDETERFGGEQVVDAALVFLDGRRVALERRSVGLAARLYVESPKRFTGRVEGYWRCWHEHGDEAAAGGIDEVLGVDVADELDRMRVADLATIARAHDVPGRSSMRRGELIAALRARRLTGS